MNPVEPRVFVNLAILYHKKKMFSLAKENLAKAKKIEKNLSSIYDILGEPDADISSISPIWIVIRK